MKLYSVDIKNSARGDVFQAEMTFVTNEPGELEFIRRHQFDEFIPKVKTGNVAYDVCGMNVDIQKELRWLNKVAEKSSSKSFEIKEVIFNNPATIVIWKDGTKTVVKRQKGDKWDKEKGLAMAIAKKVFGNKGAYCNQFKKWLNNDQEK